MCFRVLGVEGRGRGRGASRAEQGDQAAQSSTQLQRPSDSTCWHVGKKQTDMRLHRLSHLPTALSSPHFVWGRWIAHPQHCVPAAQVRRQTFQFPTKVTLDCACRPGLAALGLAGLGKDICTAHVASSEVMATRVRNVWGNVAMLWRALGNGRCWARQRAWPGLVRGAGALEWPQLAAKE
jgi:hypothetical protein